MMKDIPGPILEFINGVKFVIFSGLSLFFVAYVFRKFSEQEWKWRLTSEIKFGWALATLCFGEAIVGGTVWLSRHRINGGIDQVIPWPKSFVLATAVATAVACWGGICALRVATPRRNGEWPWMAVVIIAILASAFMAWG